MDPRYAPMIQALMGNSDFLQNRPRLAQMLGNFGQGGGPFGGQGRVPGGREFPSPHDNPPRLPPPMGGAGPSMPAPGGGYNTGIVPPHMGGSPVPPPNPTPRPMGPPTMSHMGPGSGLAPPASPTPRPMAGAAPRPFTPPRPIR